MAIWTKGELESVDRFGDIIVLERGYPPIQLHDSASSTWRRGHDSADADTGGPAERRAWFRKFAKRRPPRPQFRETRVR